MGNKERILLSIGGAIMPLIVNFYFFDFSKLTSISGDFVSYSVKFILLILIGAFIGYLNNSEESRVKMFQLGLAVPSLLAAIYSGKALEENTVKFKEEIKSHTVAEVRVPDERISFLFNAFPVVNAQVEKKDLEIYQKAEQSFIKSAWQGLTGEQPENIWFVITSSHQNELDATRAAEVINELNNGFQAIVYAPYQGNPYYAVIIGANLKLEEAKKLREDAVVAGLPGDTYLWSLK